MRSKRQAPFNRVERLVKRSSFISQKQSPIKLLLFMILRVAGEIIDSIIERFVLEI